MDNLKRPASPQPIAFSGDNTVARTAWGVHEDFAGFTKLEKAALIIAAGMLGTINTKWIAQEKDSASIISKDAVMIAKAILEEANK